MVVIYGGATPKSQQGHLKVTAWSNQLKLGKNILFLVAILLHMVTWIVVMSHGGATQGYDKVISRSNRLILMENYTHFKIYLCSK